MLRADDPVGRTWQSQATLDGGPGGAACESSVLISSGVCIISSIVAHALGSANAFYYSSKCFLTQWGKCLDHECRTLGPGVLTIQPGAMNDTNFSVAAGCKASPLFTLFDMPSDKCTDEVVWRLQNDDPRIATGVHTIGFKNQFLVSLEPWLSDSFAAWVGRMEMLQPNTPYLRSMSARESKLAIKSQ
ncbi:hypothetical protein FOZ60_002988 [Perkinsus olseni]|uniref:Uncharacterized protein n=1 Tax=Perkinsus olseni TaxID=32597 RepID=A0A7J6NWN9_PEROL|nr:hypothetical protein FOZ60_002988 [Perkinsus olseni]